MEMSVIIPTYNRCAMLRKSLDSIFLQKHVGEIEVIVIIDGCTDNSLDMLVNGFPSVKTVILKNNVGAAVSLNAGANASSGKVLLFLDDDMNCEPNLILEHQRMHDETDYDVVIGHFPLGNKPKSSFFRKVIYDWTEGWQKSFSEDVTFFDALCSGHFSIKRSLYFKAGGFDENFSVWGRKDSELGHRLVKLGARFAFCKGARSAQDYSKSPFEFLKDFESLGKADVQLYRKHPGIDQSLLLSSFYQAPWMIRFLRKSCLNFSSFTNFSAQCFNVIHKLGLETKFLEGLFWALADIFYWQGTIKAFGSAKEFDDYVQNPAAILLYHSISESKNPFFVSEKTFAVQMRYLFENKYIILSLHDVVGMIEKKEKMPKKCVVLTFDDGYKDFERAFRILKRYSFPATLYIPTENIGGVNSRDNKVMSSNMPLLNAEDIKEMISHGVDIQAHSHSHIKLGRLSMEGVAKDIQLCMEKLKTIGATPRSFSYPSGDYNADIARVIGELGFKSGVSCISTLAGRHSDILALPRITIEEGSLLDFKMRLEYGIGIKYAISEFNKKLARFRPAKWWHEADDFDCNRIYWYQGKRQEFK